MIASSTDLVESMSLCGSLSKILNALLSISLAYNYLSASRLCMQAQAHFVQAVPFDVSPLAQMMRTSVTPDIADSMDDSAGDKWLERSSQIGKPADIDIAQIRKDWVTLEVVDASFKGDDRLCMMQLDSDE